MRFMELFISSQVQRKVLKNILTLFDGLITSYKDFLNSELQIDMRQLAFLIYPFDFDY